jgi:hypothetical protein
MPLADTLAAFSAEITQCDDLIAHAHAVDTEGNAILPLLDRKQITVAAFLNMFIAWESFLESAFAAYMTGETTSTGRLPVRYVSPPNIDAAKAMIIGTQRYFDYGNHENVKKVARMFFQNGDPFEPHISSLIGDLADLRTMRNSSAHITSTTQTALESLALRLFGSPRPGIDLYQLLTSNDPRIRIQVTVLAAYRDKLLVGAALITRG